MLSVAAICRSKARTFPSVADLASRHIVTRSAVVITNRTASPLIKR